MRTEFTGENFEGFKNTYHSGRTLIEGRDLTPKSCPILTLKKDHGSQGPYLGPHITHESIINLFTYFITWYRNLNGLCKQEDLRPFVKSHPPHERAQTSFLVS